MATLRSLSDVASLPLLAVAVPVAFALQGALLARMVTGGGAFALAFLACFLLVAAPLAALELGFGRLARANGGASLSQGLEAARPGAGGRWLGLLALPVAFLGTGASLYLAGASLHYAVASAFGGPLALAPEEVEAYWRGLLGEPSPWFRGLWASWSAWFVAFVAFALLVARPRGLQVAARVLLPVAVGLAALVLVRVLPLRAASAGSNRIAPLFEPRWEALAEFATWTEAAAAAFLVAGVGLGVLPALGARLGEREDVAGRGFAVAGLAVSLALVLTMVPALLVAGQLGTGALGEALDGSAFLFVVVVRAWQTTPHAEVWAALWYAACALAFLVAGLAFVQPLMAFLVGHGQSRARGIALALAFLAGQLAVFRARSGFLAEELAFGRSLLVPLLVGAQLYVVWRVAPARLTEDLRHGSVVRVPGLASPLLAVAAPLLLVVAYVALTRAAMLDTFALTATGAGTVTVYLTRGAALLVLVVAALLLREERGDHR